MDIPSVRYQGVTLRRHNANFVEIHDPTRKTIDDYSKLLDSYRAESGTVPLGEKIHSKSWAASMDLSKLKSSLKSSSNLSSKSSSKLTTKKTTISKVPDTEYKTLYERRYNEPLPILEKVGTRNQLRVQKPLEEKAQDYIREASDRVDEYERSVSLGSKLVRSSTNGQTSSLSDRIGRMKISEYEEDDCTCD